jgi:hypothetical protein
MTTDHTNDDGYGGSEDRDAEARNYGNDETPEAPPAREPGWYWVRLIQGDEDGKPGPWAPHHVHAVVPGAVQRISVLHEWGPRIDPPGQPTEPPPLPDGWTKIRVDDDTHPCSIYSSEDHSVECYDDGDVLFAGDCTPFAKATELHAVLAHHLGLTAPVADVRVRDESEPAPGWQLLDEGRGKYIRDGGMTDLAGTWANYDAEHGYEPDGDQSRALALKVLTPYVESVGLCNLAAAVQSAYLVLKGAKP